MRQNTKNASKMAKYRARLKLKASPEFQAMDPKQQEAELAKVGEEAAIEK
jgi:hypothetical protein